MEDNLHCSLFIVPSCLILHCTKLFFSIRVLFPTVKKCFFRIFFIQVACEILYFIIFLLHLCKFHIYFSIKNTKSIKLFFASCKIIIIISCISIEHFGGFYLILCFEYLSCVSKNFTSPFSPLLQISLLFRKKIILSSNTLSNVNDSFAFVMLLMLMVSRHLNFNYIF